MDILLPVFQLLYFVAHFLVSLCQAVYDALQDLYRIAWELTRWLLRTPCKGPFALGKSPQHPILLLLPGQYKSSQLQQVAKILSALARGGASCLTVYEAAGKLRDQQWALQRVLQEDLPGFNVHLIPDETADDSSLELQQYGVESDQSPGEVLLLRIVSLESGSRALLSSVRHLAREAGPDRVVEITCEALHGYLATPTCSSCWGFYSDERRHLSTDDSPVQQHYAGEENCPESKVQMNGGMDSAARKRYLEQRTDTNSGEVDSLEVENDLKQRSKNSLPLSSVLGTNSWPLCERSNTDKTDSSLEKPLKWSATDRKWCRFGGALLPDPDLVLVVGEYISSNGFPPWFLRLSEFVSTPRLHKIDSTELTRILDNYSKREQRYGR